MNGIDWKRCFRALLAGAVGLYFISATTGLFGCTMILAGKKTTNDGSVLLAHNNDLPGPIASLINILPARDYPPGAMIDFKNGLRIPQAAHTLRVLIMYCYYGFSEGDAVGINEFQVAIAGGVALKGDRNDNAEKVDPLIKSGVSGYVRYIALQRAKTARELVEMVGEMYSTYGISYPSGFGVADVNEVWYMEAGGGTCWAARRVPDNSYMAVANGYRIGKIDFDDKENFILPPHLKETVIKKGLWRPQPHGGSFDFAAAFGGKKEKEKDYYNARRVHRIQQLLTPSLKQDAAGFRHPEILKPDKKLTIPQLITVLRDYYKDTTFDVSKAPPEGKKERFIGVFNTVHTDVIQLRGHLPADVGAVMWAGVGAAMTTPYIPYYFGVKEIPEPFQTAGPEFDENSAYWRFRGLTTRLEQGFPERLKDILGVWLDMEKRLFALQPAVEQTALTLYKKDKDAARDFLTFYSNGLALKTLEKLKARGK